MKLKRALNLSSMLVALSGILALVLTFEAPPWLTLPAATLAVSLAAVPGLDDRLRVPEKLLTPLVLAAFGFSIADFFFIGGSLVMAGADLMLILLCLKAVSLREHSDHVQLYAASFFVLLASTGLSTEIYFAVPFIMFFVSLTWALMLLTIRGEAESVSAAVSGFAFGRGFFAGTALMTAASFFVTLGIFFVIPRVGMGFMSKRAGGLLRTSGFSDTVDLGAMGEVKLDPTIVMRVRMPGHTSKPEQPLYWRGRTFDRYDGRSWKDTSDTRTAAYRTRSGDIYLRADGLPGRPLVQEIALEPLDTTTLFALNPAYMISSNIRSVRIGPGGELFLPYPQGGRLHYTVYSAPAPGAYRPEDLPGPQHLQLPEGSDTVKALADGVAGHATNARERAEAVMGYLGENQSYSLNPRRDPSLSPIDDFLTGSRTGFCEHFATAAVLMLRSAGVHARMVSGFMGGEWNGYGGYLVVREQDAHTWVEAYLPGEGWTVFDPTPPASAGETASARLGALTGVMDYLRFRWDRYIVYYNLRDQMVTAGWLSDGYYRLKRSLYEAGRTAKGLAPQGPGPARPAGAARLAAAAAALALLMAAGYAGWRLARARIRRHGGGYSVRFYAEMTRLLKRKGYAKAGGETPREFVRSLPDKIGGVEKTDEPQEGAAFLTEEYYRVRFGGLGLTAADEERVQKAMDGLREALKEGRPGG